MPRPRKRKRAASTGEGTVNGSLCTKKKMKEQTDSQSLISQCRHPVLSQYYPHVQSLREYVIAQLPPASRIRRRKISAVGIINMSRNAHLSDTERSLGTLLDTTLIGHSNPMTEEAARHLDEWKTFSQRGDDSYQTLSNGVAGFIESQALIVEYVVRTIFIRDKSAKWPDHLLCNGFRRNGALGLRTVRPNPYVEALQQSPWPQLLSLLGDSGERIMIDLLLNGDIFISVDTGTNNICQVSGRPLSNIPLYRPLPAHEKGNTPKNSTELVFVRSRMFYARPALNARGQVQFGLRHIHVLNRCPIQQLDKVQDMRIRTRLAQQNEIHTLKVMMYMFPRQFGLHNIFTSKVDMKETSQRFKDYTLREEEIVEKFGRLEDSGVQVKIPKRLRGNARNLINKLQALHRSCSYAQLLQHYCPLPLITDEPEVRPASDKNRGQVRKQGKSKLKRIMQRQKSIRLPRRNPDTPITELATPSTEVASFCQAVLKTLVPTDFWGCGLDASNNERQFLKKVDMFISLRRFEVMSLWDLSQGIKITNIEWLAPHRLMANKTSLTDMQKRWELFNEFLYFLIDSILVPLIRSNFYVTESSADKYRVFFFRHDIWRSLVEPAMITLKGKMLEEISLVEAQSILESRHLGFSHIRLLPKGTQMRPIANLRKRMPIRGRSKELDLGINKILAPAQTVLKLEKVINPDKLGSSLFSVGDIYKRLRPFKDSFSTLPAHFYFAKVDVQAAFDTIPQAAIVGLLNSIPQQRQYRIMKYLEVSPSTAARQNCASWKANPMKKWPSVAIKHDDASTFINQLESGRNATKRNTVFVGLYQKQYETSELLQLVASHIQQNLIKVGKKYYRQRQGIPQGSVLSSMLCNYFYADLETHVLSFLDSADCLLLRLIDDFLLITTDKHKAVRLVEVLHGGVPEYGISVNPQKSLVNFDLVVNDQAIPKVKYGEDFPYCGTLINTRTLELSRSSNKGEDQVIYNSLTVEFSRNPGQTFQRKVLNAFKIQSHLMFFDVGLNSGLVVLNNLYKAFVETSTKMWAYLRCLPAPKQPPSTYIIKTIKKLVDTAYVLLVSRTRRLRYPGYVCDVKKCEVFWLAYNAFLQVLSRKQSNYSQTLAWLRAEILQLSMLKNIRHARVQDIV